MRHLVFSALSIVAFYLVSCTRETCSDYILNQSEEKIDCGGPCPLCPTCFDGKMNQDETGVDCGGSCDPCQSCQDGKRSKEEQDTDCGGVCPPCSARMKATIDDEKWRSTSTSSFYASGKLVIQGTDGMQGIALHIPDEISKDTFKLAGYDAVMTKNNGDYLCICDSGYVIISVVDTALRTIVQGQFSFNCTDLNGGGTSIVEKGIFIGVGY